MTYSFLILKVEYISLNLSEPEPEHVIGGERTF